jgi:hypothetical protein
MCPLLLTLVLLAPAEPTPTPNPDPKATPATSATPTATPRPAIGILLKSEGGGGGTISRGEGLAEVAKKIKLKLPAGETARRLNNDAIRHLSQGVELTSAKPQPGDAGAGARGEAAGSAGGREGQGGPDTERFWVGLYQAARGYVRGLEQRVEDLDGEVKRLRMAFYNTDDPARRDGVIKPEWDKALADWQQATRDLEDARGLPQKVIEASRQDDAAPGWFRGLPEPEPTLAKPIIPSGSRGEGRGEGDRNR